MTTLTCPTNEKKSSAAGNKPPSSPGFRVSKITFLTDFQPAWLTSPHLPGRLHTLVFVKTTCRPRGNRVDRQTTDFRKSFSTTVNILDSCDRSP
ncbi:unnamed protein product [Macrosiphum euphorbiae]|uniref:Uncharacterized protein n=1 Tax=Macrosiphum euphorbiae TaxID=13131 RepID=A0AAV0XYD3_9HEMI|nr:unnamed protein product [Macrosiphum euphorbiae]